MAFKINAVVHGFLSVEYECSMLRDRFMISLSAMKSTNIILKSSCRKTLPNGIFFTNIIN